MSINIESYFLLTRQGNVHEYAVKPGTNRDQGRVIVLVRVCHSVGKEMLEKKDAETEGKTRKLTEEKCKG